MLSPTCTDAIPPQYWIASTLLMQSSHMYCSYPSAVLNSLHSTDAIPPQHWCYPSAVLMLFYSPTVLNSLLSTDVIPPHVLMLSLHSTEQPLQYWTASAVLNQLCTGWLSQCIFLWRMVLDKLKTSKTSQQYQSIFNCNHPVNKAW